MDCAKKDVASVEQSLNDLLSDTSHIKLNTYHAELQTAEYASRKQPVCNEAYRLLAFYIHIFRKESLS